MDLSKAISHCRPGASWSLAGNEYSGLTWHDQVQTKPTLAELQTAWTELTTPQPSPLVVPSPAFFQAIGRDLEISLKAKINETSDLNQRHFLLKFLEYPYFQSNHPMVSQFGQLLNKTPEQIQTWFQQAFAIAYPSA